MPITFHKITIAGFRAFAQETTLDLDSAGPGFHLLAGENRAEPALGANGAGKSTAWDALSWALFARTVRGASGPSVESWQDGAASTRVSVELSAGGARRVIERTRKPNALRIDGEPAEQDAVDGMLGLTHEQFSAVVLLGQFGTFFFDLGATEKLRVFGQALNLSVWERAADATAKRARELSKKIEEGEHALKSYDGEIEGLVTMLATAEEASAGWSEKKAERIAESEAKLVEAKAEHEKLIAEQKVLEEKMAAAEAESERALKAQRAMAQATKAAADAKADYGSAAADYYRVTSELNSLRGDAPDDDDDDEFCRYCGAPIVKSSAEKKKEERAKEKAKKRAEKYAKKIEELSQKAKNLYKIYMLKLEEEKIAFREKRRIHAKFRAQAAEVRKSSSDYAYFHGLFEKGKKQVWKAEAEIERLGNVIEDIKREENPHEEQIRVAKKKIKTLRKKVEKTNEAIEALRYEFSLADYWKVGFKELRLWLVEKSLREFEVAANSNMVALGLHGWKIEFDVQRAKADGKGVTKGFTVNITSPNSGGPVPWESWSGGELQRLRLAGALGFADLLRGRTGFDSNIEVYDEPTTHLSKEGVDDLLRVLEARAQTRQVWIVDHRSLEFPFKSIKTVIKQKNGTSEIS